MTDKPNEAPSPVLVTQADRDAAAEIIEVADRCGAGIIRTGKWDYCPVVLIVARHRIAEQERCAATIADLLDILESAVSAGYGAGTSWIEDAYVAVANAKGGQ